MKKTNRNQHTDAVSEKCLVPMRGILLVDAAVVILSGCARNSSASREALIEESEQ